MAFIFTIKSYNIFWLPLKSQLFYFCQNLHKFDTFYLSTLNKIKSSTQVSFLVFCVTFHFSGYVAGGRQLVVSASLIYKNK